MVYDTLKATDYLVSRPEVDPGRIGSLGISMGSTMAWWHAALDERVRACVDLCCLTDFQALIETRNLDGHRLYYYVPGLLRHFDGRHQRPDLPARPLSLAGNWDKLTPPASWSASTRHSKRCMPRPGRENAGRRAITRVTSRRPTCAPASCASSTAS